MKKTTLTLLAIITNVIMAFAGGILSNTNQSVHFLRNPARGASLEIDGVYTNPAGLVFLKEGFHFTLNNQSAKQTRTITSTYAPFAGFGGSATKKFLGEASAPFIPSFMAAYRTGKWAVSGSFNIWGGGGTAVFKDGLPSFESQIATPIAQLSSVANIPTTYSLNSRLEGSSIIYGFQLGVTYKIFDNFSAYVGGRTYTVNNGYLGYLNNVKISAAEQMTSFFTSSAAFARGIASSLEQLAQNYGSNSIVKNVLSAQQLAAMAAGLGMSPDQFGELSLALAQYAFNSAAAQLDGAAAGIDQLQNTDIKLDTEQSGFGFAPIFGANFNLNNLNIGIKFEGKSSITVKNKTKVNSTGMKTFDDGEKTPHDIAALLAIGASYKIIKPLTVSVGYHHFFEKDARMANDRHKTLDGGTNEILAGIEYKINKMFLVSFGFQSTRSGATDAYQQDLSFSLKSETYGFGGAVNITKNLRVNLAYLTTVYQDWTKNTTNYNNSKDPAQAISGTDVFSRTNQAIGIGIDFSF